MKKIKQNLALLSIIISALAIRLYSIYANLPLMYWHDENNYIDNALRFGTGNLELITLTHGALYQIVLFLGYSGYYVFGKIAGFFHSPIDLYLGYLKDPTSLFLIARGITVICGVGTVYLTYLVGRKIYGRNIGLAAGLFAGFSLLMVQMSSLALADVPSVFILMLSFISIVYSIEKPGEVRFYYAAAVLIGLAAACKYFTVFGIAPLYVAAFIKGQHLEHRAKGILRLIMCGSFFVFLGSFIGMPFFLLNLDRFYQEAILSNSGAYILTNTNENIWLFYFTNHIRNGLGVPLGILSVCGILYAMYKRSKWDILLVSTPIAHYILFMHSTGFAYHLLPVIPFMFILSARLLYSVINKLFPKFVTPVFVCACIMIVIPTACDSVKFMKVISGPDTRTIAKVWIEKNIPAGAEILEEGYISAIPIHGPVLTDNLKTLRRDLDSAVLAGGSGIPLKMRMENFDRLYAGSKLYDMFKKYAISADEAKSTSASYIIISGDNDNPTGPEFNYSMPKNYYEEREKMMNIVLSRYELIKSFAPSYQMTAWVPHMSDLDYVALRSVKWDNLKDYIKGPRIDVFKLRG